MDYAIYEDTMKQVMKEQMRREAHDIDVIIPTWNSMPEFKVTLESLKAASYGFFGEVIVVDRASTDGTVELAKEYGCTLLTDTVSLGSARLKGLQHAKTDYVAFVDSDIELPPEWVRSMLFWTWKLMAAKINYGWIFGRTLDDRPKVRRMQEWEMKNRSGLYGGFKNGWNIVPPGRRGFTNNTICLREPLLKAAETNIKQVSGHEDWILSQVMHQQGYSIVEVPVTVNHLRVHTFGKWGGYSEAWNICGQRQAGLHPKLRQYLWVLKRGFEFSWRFRDPWYLKYFSGQFWGVLKALYGNPEFKR